MEILGKGKTCFFQNKLTIKSEGEDTIHNATRN